MPHAYTEDQLVEQPAIGLFAELGWAVAGPSLNAGILNRLRLILLGLFWLGLSASVQAQFACTTNADGSLNISQYNGSGGMVIIPDTINNLPVTSIGAYAFGSLSDLTGVLMGTNLTSIGERAFNSTSLSDITIPNNVTNIEAFAFFGCNNLTNVTLSTNLSEIKNGTFLDCALQSITIPNSVTVIGGNAFQGSSLTSLIIPNSVTNIGYSAFSFCSSLTNVAIGTNVSVMGGFVFWSCVNLTSITLPNGLTNISENMFEDCYSLASVTLPDSIRSIGPLAFSWCSSLTNIIIPSSVTNIEYQAFLACTALTNVYFQGNAPSVSSDSFNYDPAAAYYLPKTTGWNDFALAAGIFTKLWLPLMQTSDGNFGVQENGFGFNVFWASGQTVVVEACTNLSNPEWQPLQTNTLTGDSVYFGDTQLTNYPSRFYRIRSP